MQSGANPVVVYETKPATEWLMGGPVQKMSPKFWHAALQGAMHGRLRAWAETRGRVGPEWRFWLTPPGERERYLVPDVAFLSYERLARSEIAAAQEPHVAPELAVEIISPSERPDHMAHKVDVYLRSGTLVVLQIDPARRTATVHDASGVRVLRDGDTFTHAALAGFSLPLAELFAELDR